MTDDAPLDQELETFRRRCRDAHGARERRRFVGGTRGVVLRAFCPCGHPDTDVSPAMGATCGRLLALARAQGTERASLAMDLDAALRRHDPDAVSFRALALRGLAPAEVVHADQSGVVRGATADVPPEGGVRYACVRCRVLVERPHGYLSAELRRRGEPDDVCDDPVGTVTRQELLVRGEFVALALTRGCTHLAQRLATP